MKSQAIEDRDRETDLGLAISGALMQPGETRTLREMAYFLPISWQALWLIEKRALKRVRKKLYCDPELSRQLKEMLERL